MSAKDVVKRRKLYAAQKVAEPFFLHIRHDLHHSLLPAAILHPTHADITACCSPAYVIDATHKGNRSCFMTHSFSPNCQMQNWTVDNQQTVYVLAVKDIAPGTELTYTFYQHCSLGQHVRCTTDYAIAVSRSGMIWMFWL